MESVRRMGIIFVDVKIAAKNRLLNNVLLVRKSIMYKKETSF